LTRVPRVLTVAGSDSGGGAGIQADLKTIAALGGHGMSAITSLTAQNTYEVTAIVDVDTDFIREQIRVCVKDIGVDAVKTGMLHTEQIIKAVAEELQGIEAPRVVDPVMIAKSGASLLKPGAVESLKKEILPMATVLTPNAREASVLSGMSISSLEDQKRAAKTLAEEYGIRGVVVKGGHIAGDMVTDILYFEGSFHEYSLPRIDTRATHGTGCVFASAIATELAKGASIPEAVERAKRFVHSAIKGGFQIGKGAGPVNPMAQTARNAALLETIERMRLAVKVLEEVEGATLLLPECMINIGEAIPGATSREEVVAIPGRIVGIGRRLKASSHPWMGASRHVANTILTVMSYDPNRRAAMNIKYSREVIEAAKELGLSVSSYDRSQEPADIKAVEGMTIRWGVARAYEAAGKVTDLIYHTGDWGKEPMITITGADSIEVVTKFKRILEKILDRISR